MPSDAHRDPRRTAVWRGAAGLGIYAAAFGATFGAVAVAAGLSLTQTLTVSAVMFTGASQLAFVGVVATGGNPLAGVPAALLLGVRNAFYGVPVAALLRPRGWRRPVAAQLVIDETAAMATAQDEPELGRLAFWASGVVLFLAWVAGTAVGAVAGDRVDTAALGLDAAGPAVFVALLWPQLRRRSAPVVAVAGAVLALALIPVAPAGVPVLAAAVVALAVGLTDPAPRVGAS